MEKEYRHPLRYAAAIAAACLCCVSATAAQRVVQLAEDGVSTRQLPTAAAQPLAAPLERVCEPDAKWLRLGFKELSLKGYDSLTVTGSDGAHYTFEGDRWSGRSFSMRALEGECVEIKTYFRDPASRFEIESYQYGKQALADSPVIVAGAGDICDSTGTVCSGTSDKIIEINPTAVFTAGDNAYSSGTLTEFNTRYEPYWGRFKELTNPSPGNHEYGTSGASGYFDYFNGVGVQTGPAGDRAKGYYSWDVGDWHFVSLNSMKGGTIAQAQLDWLRADLAANTKPCTAAYWHHPLVSVGNYSPGIGQVKPFWDALYAAHADLVLVGHDHNYQRFAPMNPDQAADANGMRQVLIGTGGRYFYSIRATHPLLEASTDSSFGVLKLSLTSTGYTGEFVRSTGTFSDTFSGTCHNAPPPNVPPVADFGFSTDGLDVQFTDRSTDSDGTIASRAWSFGDGGSSSETSPSHVYASSGSYTVTLTVTDDGGATDSKTAFVTVEGRYRVGGTVSGLAGSGLVLQLDGANDLAVTADGAFSFAADLASGSAYAVSVATQPISPRQTCTVANGSGEIAHADVGDVAVSCTTTTWTVTPSVASGQGQIDPALPQTVTDGSSASFTLTPATGYHIAAAGGCGGHLNGSVYTTAAVSADCAVEASFAIDTFTVGASVTAGQGSVTPTTQTVEYGASASFTLAPATGHHVATASGCGGSLNGNTYTTAAVTADCAVAVSFAIDTFTVDAHVSGQGTVMPPTQTAEYGERAGFKIEPAAGHHIASVSGCGGSLDGNVYTTAAITADCTIDVSFAIDRHAVSAVVEGGHGSIDPATQTVDDGAVAHVTLTPDAGYKVAAVQGDCAAGSLQGGGYETGAIRADCTIKASFVPDSAETIFHDGFDR